MQRPHPPLLLPMFMHNLAKRSDETAAHADPAQPAFSVVRVDGAEAIPPSVVFSESPSLNTDVGKRSPAYELKFLLTALEAAQVEAALRRQLAPDPHADPTLGGAYRITTLYCDTPNWDVFNRVGFHQHRKFRLRRYGDSLRIYLERKTKHGLRVEKRRDAIDDGSLVPLHAEETCDDWAGAWFHKQLRKRELRPVARVTYLRRAFFGAAEDKPVRLTFDRELQGGLVPTWTLDAPQTEASLLGDAVICEFKFRDALPLVFKDVITEMQLLPRGISKYRHCIEALGGPIPRSEHHA